MQYSLITSEPYMKHRPISRVQAAEAIAQQNDGPLSVVEAIEYLDTFAPGSIIDANYGHNYVVVQAG